MKRESAVRWCRLTAISLVGLFVAGAGAVISVQPALAALVCPSCFGFEQLSGRVFVDSAMPETLRQQLASAIRESETKLIRFYGVLSTAPEVLACATETCWQRLGGGGGAKGASYAYYGLRLSPLGIDPVIIAHERSHIELHGRIGLRNFIMGAIPAWFDEGLAVIVSGDPRYLLPSTESDRCRVKAMGLFPASSKEWRRAAAKDPDLYGRAACRVLTWLKVNGGTPAVLMLVKKVSDGVPFSGIFRDQTRGKS
jgi:hypothetical protein